MLPTLPIFWLAKYLYILQTLNIVFPEPPANVISSLRIVTLQCYLNHNYCTKVE